MHHNIEKSATKKGEYVGYTDGTVWRIYREGRSEGFWWVACDTFKFYSTSLVAISERLEWLTTPIGKMTMELAMHVGISEETIKQCNRLLRNGVPELVEAVREDRMELSLAVKIADLPPDYQRNVIEFHNNQVHSPN